jgi:hypothetical protein
LNGRCREDKPTANSNQHQQRADHHHQFVQWRMLVRKPFDRVFIERKAKLPPLTATTYELTCTYRAASANQAGFENAHPCSASVLAHGDIYNRTK